MHVTVFQFSGDAHILGGFDDLVQATDDNKDVSVQSQTFSHGS